MFRLWSDHFVFVAILWFLIYGLVRVLILRLEVIF